MRLLHSYLHFQTLDRPCSYDMQIKTSLFKVRLSLIIFLLMLASDKSKYLQGNLPGPDSVLYIGDMTKSGDDTVIMVTAAANKNNKALDVVVGDAWLIVEGLSNKCIRNFVMRCLLPDLSSMEPVQMVRISRSLLTTR